MTATVLMGTLYLAGAAIVIFLTVEQCVEVWHRSERRRLR